MSGRPAWVEVSTVMWDAWNWHSGRSGWPALKPTTREWRVNVACSLHCAGRTQSTSATPSAGGSVDEGGANGGGGKGGGGSQAACGWGFADRHPGTQ